MLKQMNRLIIFEEKAEIQDQHPLSQNRERHRTRIVFRNIGPIVRRCTNRGSTVGDFNQKLWMGVQNLDERLARIIFNRDPKNFRQKYFCPKNFFVHF